MNPTPAKNPIIQQKAAMYLLRKGIATMSEVAALQGWSRQRMYKAARNMDARKQRQQYLQRLWLKTINRLS